MSSGVLQTSRTGAQLQPADVSRDPEVRSLLFIMVHVLVHLLKHNSSNVFPLWLKKIDVLGSDNSAFMTLQCCHALYQPCKSLSKHTVIISCVFILQDSAGVGMPCRSG